MIRLFSDGSVYLYFKLLFIFEIVLFDLDGFRSFIIGFPSKQHIFSHMTINRGHFQMLILIFIINDSFKFLRNIYFYTYFLIKKYIVS